MTLFVPALGAFAEGGPWSGRRGHENQGQCVTGMMERYGGDGPPLMQPYLVNDIGTGALSAFGALLGLYQRFRTGDGCIVRATLTQTATLHQGPYMLDYKGKVWDEPRGTVATGWGPLQRMYRAADGWFFLGATQEQRTTLASVEGLGGITGLSDDDLASDLERRFETETRDVWVHRLVRSGLGAHALLNLVDLVNDPVAQDLGSVYFETRGESRTPMSAPAPRLSGTPVRENLPLVRMPGIDAASILKDLGIGDRLQALIDAKVIRVPSTNAGPLSR
jgi:crotonobetainyl-CoA:carnitine CoA-transferase CaiB-like acyl-CoA transferase